MRNHSIQSTRLGAISALALMFSVVSAADADAPASHEMLAAPPQQDTDSNPRPSAAEIITALNADKMPGTDIPRNDFPIWAQGLSFTFREYTDRSYLLSCAATEKEIDIVKKSIRSIDNVRTDEDGCTSIQFNTKDIKVPETNAPAVPYNPLVPPKFA